MRKIGLWSLRSPSIVTFFVLSCIHPSCVEVIVEVVFGFVGIPLSVEVIVVEFGFEPIPLIEEVIVVIWLSALSL